ncbi:MAG: ATP-binding protein [Bacteroidetes bacterium]|nr:ATP-binding protein [Bacteroidota bacterium]
MQNRKPYKLAVKFGLTIAAVTGVALSILQWLVWEWSWTGTFIVILVAFLSAYWACEKTINARLSFAKTAVKHIRKHTFETSDLIAASRGDEIDDLIRQVYRTGSVVSKEFEELKNLEHHRRDFIGNVSHEFKTPIFAIRGFAETLLGGALEDTEVRVGFVEKIVRNADRLANLAKDLSEISRLETGEKAIILAPFVVSRWIADVVDSVESMAQATDINLQTSLSDNSLIAVGDAIQLRQVLTNLVVNAIKYSNPGNHVFISAQLTKDGVIEIAVRDHGIGISKEHIGRLTERFFRVDKSRSRLGGGTGLGLSIVKHILAAHDQVLQIKSQPGVGSTFKFDLPVAPKQSKAIPDPSQGPA